MEKRKAIVLFLVLSLISSCSKQSSQLSIKCGGDKFRFNRDNTFEILSIDGRKRNIKLTSVKSGNSYLSIFSGKTLSLEFLYNRTQQNMRVRTIQNGQEIQNRTYRCVENNDYDPDFIKTGL